MLPVGEIEPAFSPAVPVCREEPLRSGRLDDLLITPLGELVAVECKLWPNPQAWRQVLEQVIYDAKDLQAFNYEGLEAAVPSAREGPR